MGVKTENETRITMICPNLTCRRTLSAPVSARGQVMKCPYCDSPFRVPGGANPSPGAGAKGGKK